MKDFSQQTSGPLVLRKKKLSKCLTAQFRLLDTSRPLSDEERRIIKAKLLCGSFYRWSVCYGEEDDSLDNLADP